MIFINAMLWQPQRGLSKSKPQLYVQTFNPRHVRLIAVARVIQPACSCVYNKNIWLCFRVCPEAPLPPARPEMLSSFSFLRDVSRSGRCTKGPLLHSQMAPLLLPLRNAHLEQQNCCQEKCKSCSTETFFASFSR